MKRNCPLQLYENKECQKNLAIGVSLLIVSALSICFIMKRKKHKKSLPISFI